MGCNLDNTYTCDWCGRNRDARNKGYTNNLPTGWIYGKRGCYCSQRCLQSAGDEKSGCFITTAVCQSRNLPDDCHELTSLRKFRDEFMKKDELMKAEVSEYYEIAPKICESIDKLSDSKAIYEELWQNHIKAAVEAVDSNQKEKAHEIYRNMVLELKEKYL